jgi:hypothetical protein
MKNNNKLLQFCVIANHAFGMMWQSVLLERLPRRYSPRNDNVTYSLIWAFP